MSGNCATGIAVIETPTTPIPGQKTGTSGLRKKTKEFASGSYLANWVQALFNSLGGDLAGASLGLGGDGEGTEFVDPRGEREILSGLGAGGDGHATFLGVEAGVGDDEIVGTGSETGERIRAVAIGEDRAVGAVDLDLGAIKEKTRALIRNGACNRARAGLRAEAGGSEGKREEAEQPGGEGARPRGN